MKLLAVVLLAFYFHNGKGSFAGFVLACSLKRQGITGSLHRKRADGQGFVEQEGDVLLDGPLPILTYQDAGGVCLCVRTCVENGAHVDQSSKS